MREAREVRMDDIGETEDIPDTDVGAAAPGGVTTAVTIIQKTVWEQTLLAFQQLGVRERLGCNAMSTLYSFNDSQIFLDCHCVHFVRRICLLLEILKVFVKEKLFYNQETVPFKPI